MNGVNYWMDGFLVYLFNIFGNGWEKYIFSLFDLFYKGDIVIGNDVWIGMDIIIMFGIKIGDGVIIVVKFVVIRDVVLYIIVGGNLVNKIKERFLNEIIEELL